MSEVNPRGFGGVNDWRGHYNTVSGPEKIEARQRVYWLAVEQESREGEGSRIDLEIETLDALRHAGVSEAATVVDIGCSYPNFLQLWRLNGHRGKLIGIEPNVAQLDGLAYMKPSSIASDGAAYELSSPYEGIRATKNRAGFEGIELYEAYASSIPLQSGVADVASMMLMMYHVPKAVQRDALEEAKRIQNRDTGIFALTTRSKDNKGLLRVGEAEIGQELSAIRGQKFTPPPPVNSGFTSEDAADVLPKVYDNVYVYEHKADIIVDSSAAVGIVERALWSLLDKYVDSAGRPPTEEQFDQAVNKVYGKQFLAACAGRLALKDLLHESLFIASDREVDLPAKFSKL